MLIPCLNDFDLVTEWMKGLQRGKSFANKGDKGVMGLKGGG